MLNRSRWHVQHAACMCCTALLVLAWNIQRFACPCTMQVKEATRGMLEALQSVAAEHPQLNLLQRVESEAGVKLPAAEASCASRPSSAAPSARSGLCGSPSRGGSRPASGARGTPVRLAGCRSPSAASARSPGGSRPGSCAGSVRSAAAAGVAAGSPGSARSPAVQTVQLQL